MRIFICFILLSLLSACASGPKKSVKLELKSPQKVGYSAYRSVTQTQEMVGAQTTRDRQESVDFIIKAEPAPPNSLAKNAPPVAVVLSAVAKEGNQNLNEYGFPELKESIEFHYTPSGKVLKAGAYSESSLFFIPPIPLPQEAVEVGDTWEIKHDWISDSGGLLRLTAVGIFKDFKKCGRDSCAWIEISGSVEPLGIDQSAVQVQSRIYGDLLFSLSAGEVYSSEVRSTEKLSFPHATVASQSCMVSVETDKKDLKSVQFPKACQ